MTAIGSGRPIGVLGSANMDLVVRVDAFPRPGETIFGHDFSTVPGGKGLNQAVAAARAGADVRFVGAVGTDAYGAQLRELLAREGMSTDHVKQVGATGTAHITVDASGQNSIVVVSGANREVAADQLATLLGELGWLATQLELNPAVVGDALARARDAGTRTALTPAPARPLAAELLASVDLLVPNELEACTLTGARDPLTAAARLSEICGDVVVTLGADGCAWATGGQVVRRVPGRRVRAVDTTAAGDTFVGVLLTLLAEGGAMERALDTATVAASIAVTRPGATSSMPTRDEIDAELAN